MFEYIYRERDVSVMIMPFPSFSSSSDDHQCTVQDDDLFFLRYRKDTVRCEEERKGIFLCPQSLERAGMNMHLIAILFSLSRVRLLGEINLLGIISSR